MVDWALKTKFFLSLPFKIKKKKMDYDFPHNLSDNYDIIITSSICYITYYKYNNYLYIFYFYSTRQIDL